MAPNVFWKFDDLDLPASNSTEFSMELSASVMDIFSVTAGAGTELNSYWSDTATNEDIWSETKYIKKTVNSYHLYHICTEHWNIG